MIPNKYKSKWFWKETWERFILNLRIFWWNYSNNLGIHFHFGIGCIDLAYIVVSISIYDRFRLDPQLYIYFLGINLGINHSFHNGRGIHFRAWNRIFLYYAWSGQIGWWKTNHPNTHVSIFGWEPFGDFWGKVKTDTFDFNMNNEAAKRLKAAIDNAGENKNDSQ
jgi:hypothetical protein